MRAIAIELTLDLAAAGLLGYGAWLWFEPAGFMVGGALCLWASVSIGRARRASAGPAK